MATPQGGIAQQLWSGSTPPPTPESPEIVLVRDYSIDDGRYVNNSLAQEMPDPIAEADLGQCGVDRVRAYAETLSVETGDLIRIAVSDASPKTTTPAEAQPAPPPPPPPAVRELEIAVPSCSGSRRQFGHHPARLRSR